MIWHFTLFLTATLLAIIAGVTLELSIRADDAGDKDTAYFLYLFGILADIIQLICWFFVQIIMLKINKEDITHFSIVLLSKLKYLCT